MTEATVVKKKKAKAGKSLAKPEASTDLGFLGETETKKHVKGSTVPLIAIKCVHYMDSGHKRMAMPGELFSIEGTDGNPKLDIKPTTAKQEADRLVKLGVAKGG